ncbi:uncharacterized protein DUF4339 [Prosthecobacter fusiformis]|uniref:Uncharacterized protein DUF4339 n=1 Tax=Prosthecobacter fusiformis TaxID=48464 RepID=A0A4R7SSL2_9BACT|nr:CD225/dispanin family protein [Prosthecobacter fusiformis]TDU81207.1 uncharacterized protein DUF4339 [Prosthecobacter fusiformis]
MNWYYSKDGAQLGPVSQDELAGMIAEGSIQPNDLVWKEGMSGWTPAAAIPELRGATTMSAPGGAPALPSPPLFSNPYQAPVSPVGSTYGEPIPNYLWQSITVTVLCCLPFGIPAIVYASKVDGLASSGNYAGAKQASEKAKMWCWVSFGLSMAVFVFYVIMMIIGGAAQATGGF